MMGEPGVWSSSSIGRGSRGGLVRYDMSVKLLWATRGASKMAAAGFCGAARPRLEGSGCGCGTSTGLVRSSRGGGADKDDEVLGVAVPLLTALGTGVVEASELEPDAVLAGTDSPLCVFVAGMLLFGGRPELWP
jgi:hypothetical protein